MEIDKYVSDQINWNNRKSIINKNYAYTCALITIIGSVLVASLVKIMPDVALVLSIVVAISSGINNYFKFQDKWKVYRLTAEALGHEQLLYTNRIGSYSNSNAKDIYTKKIVELASNSNQEWSEALFKDKADQR